MNAKSVVFLSMVVYHWLETSLCQRQQKITRIDKKNLVFNESLNLSII